ncbi:MAG: acyltransferase [Mesorhizobium sp.]|uniref:acyltransferase n=1 Tax=Mesorhizobium sp. TaxID=1871066 RepID=UPI000FE51277|nr:acyltransferase [Mesorhizobium sp.]RWH73879.1 MAG: acyltransferase [Mesorhizobium sp.]RWH78381.1 MAG: acyltransferase [Mesorhizobium sp.]RWH87673.1 MAG: acyltransferase [Mesorhizobium sp.]RWH94356.1 MAG: acyltransferase [Mesorhizobium sp.]RWH97715.1 MAG: acyltransferase [Mesorhizobium sp.]
MPFVPPFLQRLAGVNVGVGTKMNIQSVRTARRGRHAIGEDGIINCYFSFDRPEAQITIGRRCYIGKSHLVAAEHITLGDDVVISWGTTIVDHNSHSLDWKQRANDVANWHQGKKNWAGVGIAPVTIEDNVWIGFGVTILKGVTIGKGAVVGAASVVTKDVAPFTIVAGVPAAKIRDISEEYLTA